MSYTKLMKQWEKESKQKREQENKYHLELLQKDQEYKIKLFFAKDREQKAENERLERERIERSEKVDTFLYEQGKHLSYREWLTLRDILTNNYMQVEYDLQKGKINNEQLKKLNELSLKVM